ncbi:MAG: FadR family transcriptional regulator [Chloroflexi bacterium]|nr:FadR family transcriptional regulator [Chloroflexota bacterium]
MSDKLSVAVNPLSRVTLADRVLVELRSQIRSGQLRPGEQLPTEDQLGAAFGVSRTTIREALRGLVAGNFLSRRRNRLVVTGAEGVDQEQWDLAAIASRASVRDMIEARKLIEVRLAELAAEHWSGTDLEDLRELLRRTEQPHDESFHGADAAFHDGIARICRNQVLAEVYAHSRDLFFRLPSYWQLFKHARGARHHGSGETDHREVFEAIEARDSVAAGRSMARHLDHIKADMILRFEPTAKEALKSAS